ncbi:hypothetical protein D3C76_165280 [compost metagenome]
MAQHPMTKAFVAALVKNGGKKFKAKFNMYQLDQTMIFGYRRFDFRVMSAGTVPSWDMDYMPKGVNDRADVVLIPVSNFGAWLACDTEAEKEYAEFRELIAKTIGHRAD